jgi:cell wall-associated NlpC family hydrolase
MSAAAFALAAQALVGARFRLHGRDPATGLDCIGVFVAALAAIGRSAPVPTGYPLRLSDPARWLPAPEACGFEPAQAPYQPGDAVLIGLGAGQFHLAIGAPCGGWIHAHAGARRVLLSSGLPGERVLHCWRLPNSNCPS